MSPPSASIGAGYYRLEAYSEFIKSHTDYELCEPPASQLFCSARLNRDTFTLEQSVGRWIRFHCLLLAPKTQRSFWFPTPTLQNLPTSTSEAHK